MESINNEESISPSWIKNHMLLSGIQSASAEARREDSASGCEEQRVRGREFSARAGGRNCEGGREEQRGRERRAVAGRRKERACACVCACLCVRARVRACSAERARSRACATPSPLGRTAVSPPPHPPTTRPHAHTRTDTHSHARARAHKHTSPALGHVRPAGGRRCAAAARHRRGADADGHADAGEGKILRAHHMAHRCACARGTCDRARV